MSSMYSKRQQFLEVIEYLNDLINIYKYEEENITSQGFYNEFNDPNSFWSLNITNIDIIEFDKILDIVGKIIANDSTYLQHMSYIKTFIENILINLKNEHDNRRGWRYRYPELLPNIYDIEEDIMCAIKNLLEFMKMSPFDLFEMRTTCEKVSLRNVCFENRLPYDIERFTSGFIGF
jgi:hypothetical protein